MEFNGIEWDFIEHHPHNDSPAASGTSQCCCRAAGRDCDKIIRLSSRTGTVPTVYVAATIYETICRIDKNWSSFVYIYIYGLRVSFNNTDLSIQCVYNVCTHKCSWMFCNFHPCCHLPAEPSNLAHGHNIHDFRLGRKTCFHLFGDLHWDTPPVLKWLGTP